MPPLPSDNAALLLDLDGTLIDIAPAPDLVVVPAGLPATLRRLRDRLGGALAVVSGRPIEQIDALLGDAPYAVAGEHGGAIRHAPNGAIERAALASAPAAWLTEAAAIADQHPGVLLERKQRGFVLHYRAVPAIGPSLREALDQVLGGDARFALMAAHMAWEVKPHGADKGTAVKALMARKPFTGRQPIYIGDDVTDEDGIAAAQALGGHGLRVAEAFGAPGDVRVWLNQAAS